MVGDSLRDIEAGLAMGMKTIFVTDGDHQMSENDVRAKGLATVTISSLPEMVKRLQYLLP